MFARRVLLLLVCGIGCALVAAAEEPALELAVPDRPLSIGDRIEVQAMARGPQDLLWGELRVRAEEGGDWQVVEGPQALAGSVPPAWRVSLVPMKTGDIGLPEFVVSVRSQDGSERDIKPAAATTVTVASVLASEDEIEPAPLKAPTGPSGLAWEYLPPVIAVLAPLLLLVAWLWKRRGAPGATSLESQLPPLDELQQQMEIMQSRLGRESAELSCDRLAQGMRRYLERRLGEPALEMTSSELWFLGNRLAWPDEVRRGVQDSMRIADAVRFGKQRATLDQLGGAADRVLETATRLEQHLTPADEDAKEVSS